MLARWAGLYVNKTEYMHISGHGQRDMTWTHTGWKATGHWWLCVLCSSREYILIPQPHVELFLGHRVADLTHCDRHVPEDIPRLCDDLHA